MKRQVKAWAVVIKRGQIGKEPYQYMIYSSKKVAKYWISKETGERVIPVTVTWEEE